MHATSTRQPIWRTFFQGPLDWLLLAVPAALAIRFVPGWGNELLLFATASLAIIPLAGWMGRATEMLSTRVGAGVGGLLNATFGNTAELIIAFIALTKGLPGVVKASLTGSIIGNLLFVLGVSVFVGGSRREKQSFNATAARSSCTTMSLAAAALIIPTVFHVASRTRSGGWSPVVEQRLSLAIAALLFVMYLASLFFSLVTHKALFAGPMKEEENPAAPKASLARAFALLGIATALVAVLSEFLVGSIESARESIGVTETFVGIFIVAIVGNAAEHSTAVMSALKDEMDLCLSISVGSSMQVALFVTPVLVFVSYALGHPMDLEFSLPEIVAVAVAVWMVQQISSDGESNWLEGAQLISVYLILAVLFFFLPEATHSATPTP